MIRFVLPTMVALAVAFAPPASAAEKVPPRKVVRDGKTCLQYSDPTGRLIERCPGEPRRVLSDPDELPLIEALPDADSVYGRAATYQLSLQVDGTVLTSHYVSTTLTTGVVRGLVAADYFLANGFAIGLEGGGRVVREQGEAGTYLGSRVWGAWSSGPRVVLLPFGPVAYPRASGMREALQHVALSLTARVHWLWGSDPDGTLSGYEPGFTLGIRLPSLSPSLGLGLSYAITVYQQERRRPEQMFLLTATVFTFGGPGTSPEPTR